MWSDLFVFHWTVHFITCYFPKVMHIKAWGKAKKKQTKKTHCGGWVFKSIILCNAISNDCWIYKTSQLFRDCHSWVYTLCQTTALCRAVRLAEFIILVQPLRIQWSIIQWFYIWENHSTFCFVLADLTCMKPTAEIKKLWLFL